MYSSEFLKKLTCTWNCAPWCIIPKVVHNVANGAQMPFFSYEMVQKYPPEVQTDRQRCISSAQSASCKGGLKMDRFSGVDSVVGHVRKINVSIKCGKRKKNY